VGAIRTETWTQVKGASHVYCLLSIHACRWLSTSTPHRRRGRPPRPPEPGRIAPNGRSRHMGQVLATQDFMARNTWSKSSRYSTRYSKRYATAQFPPTGAMALIGAQEGLLHERPTLSPFADGAAASAAPNARAQSSGAPPAVLDLENSPSAISGPHAVMAGALSSPTGGGGAALPPRASLDERSFSAPPLAAVASPRRPSLVGYKAVTRSVVCSVKVRPAAARVALIWARSLRATRGDAERLAPLQAVRAHLP
jgi:hypothetical protein